jgi:zinc/manganese transport system permease protein
MFTHEFVRNAYLAGTFVALACGTVGWLVVLRGQVFAGDALSHVAFVGAIAAAVIGVDVRFGLFALTAVAGLLLAGLRGRASSDDALIGIVFAWMLGIGVLLITLLATSASAGNGLSAVNTLFGSIYELSPSAAQLAAGIGLMVTVIVLVAFRPMLLASLDPEVATLRGIRVRALAIGLLVALAIVTAETTQAVGALLLLGLIAAPAGAAHQLTARPYRGLALSAGIALGAMWGGLALSYAVGSLPPSSAVIGLAAAAFVVARVASGRRARLSSTGRATGPTSPAAPRSG